MIPRIAVWLSLLMLALPGAVQAADEIKITSDSFTINETTGKAEFSGKVIIKHPTLTLWADKVEVTYGAEVGTEIQYFVASGKVRIQNETQTATGEQAVFDPATQILRLTGKVIVRNGPTVVAGPELIVDLANNTSTFSNGGTTGRVTGVFTQ